MPQVDAAKPEAARRSKQVPFHPAQKTRRPPRCGKPSTSWLAAAHRVITVLDDRVSLGLLSEILSVRDARRAHNHPARIAAQRARLPLRRPVRPRCAVLRWGFRGGDGRPGLLHRSAPRGITAVVPSGARASHWPPRRARCALSHPHLQPWPRYGHGVGP